MSSVTVLAPGQDTVLPLNDDQVVSATSATLTSGAPIFGGSTTTYAGGDRLDGGAGYDVLSLTGSGNFDLSRLEQFAGFEAVRLTNTSSIPASLTLRDGVDLAVTLSDGTEPRTVERPGYYPGTQVTLGTGLVTLQGSNASDTISASAPSKLRAGSVIDGGAGYDSLSLSYDYAAATGTSRIDPATGLPIYVPPVSHDTVYDLTSIDLSRVERLDLLGGGSNGTTVAQVDTAALADVRDIFGFANKLVTAAASLDLTDKSVRGVVVESTNSTGTAFTTNSAATALQIQGGSGRDTLMVSSSTLTSAQRDQVFASSIEALTDASGTYARPATPGGTTVLTAGQDTVLPSDADQVVTATSATLTSGAPIFGGSTTTYAGGDRLDGGAGYDVLSLTGSGNFDLSRLEQFAGFEEVRLTNVSSNSADLNLRDGVDIVVTLSDGTAPPTSSFPVYSPGSRVTLGTGIVTLRGGNGGDTISALAASKLRAGSVIDGGAGHDSLNLSYDYATAGGTFQIDPVTGLSTYVSPVYRDTVYDLTGISLSGVETLSVNGSYGRYGNTTTIVEVDTASLANVTRISSYSSGKLVTASAALDLTGKSVGGIVVESTNTTGTTFTTDSAATALQVQGGAGQDTLVVRGSTLTSAQRDQVFTGSIETLIDAAGTYAKPATPSAATVLTAGQDTVLPLDADQLVSATSATLTAGSPVLGGSTTAYAGGDRLDGGAGYDVLSLTGSGSFDLSRLDRFAGFEEVRLTNAASGSASLTLRDGVDLTVSLTDGTASPPSGSLPFSSGTSVTLGTGLVTLRGSNGGDTISASAAGKLRAGSVIDGGAGNDVLRLSYDVSSAFGSLQTDPVTGALVYLPPVFRDTVYDLTAISLQHVEKLDLIGALGAYGDTTTVVKVDTAALAGVTTIFAFGGAKLVTAAASLDLTGKSISGLVIESTNAAGTTFTVDSVATALQVRGGAGQDTLVVGGLTLTSAQRDQVFAGSIETLTDAAGTYTEAGPPPAVVTIVDGTADGETLAASSAADWTLNGLGGNDVLVGGAGSDILDGGEGVDTVVLSGRRSDYSVSKDSAGLIVKDLRGSSTDGTDRVTDVEAFRFLGGEATPAGAIRSGFSSETLQGTAGRDLFFFDTALGLKLGADTLRNFGEGDRLVTTSKFYDGNNDGRIAASGDRFLLPDAFYDAKSDTGSVKVTSSNGAAVKTLVLAGTIERDGVAYYAYAAAGDTVAGTGVTFEGASQGRGPLTYTGTSASDDFAATPGANWTINGLAGNDRLQGSGGNDVLDGGAGIDTVVLSGARGDYSFVKTAAGLAVTGAGAGASDGADTIKGVETFAFLGGSGRPADAIASTFASETLTGTTGTATHDTFYFDTDAGLALGADTIRNFGDGDRLVTTSAIFDGNNDGIISTRSGASFTLPGTSADAVADSAGSVKLFTDAGQSVSSLKLLANEQHDGVTYYSYAAPGDPTTHAGLLFT